MSTILGSRTLRFVDLKNEPDSYRVDIPLVVIGDGGKYKEKVKNFITNNHLENKVIFLSEHFKNESFISAKDFPAIYQSAVAMIYPSIFEGFGIPVLEALFSMLPVITSNISSLPEAGGNNSYYIDPNTPDEIAEGMKKIYYDYDFTNAMKEKGWHHAQNFTTAKCASSVMDVYKSIW